MLRTFATDSTAVAQPQRTARAIRRLYVPAFHDGTFDSAADALRHLGFNESKIDDALADAIELSNFCSATTIYASLSFELSALVMRDHAAGRWQLWLAVLTAPSITAVECRGKIKNLQANGFHGPWKVVTPWRCKDR